MSGLRRAIIVAALALFAGHALAESRDFSFKSAEGFEFRGVIDLPAAFTHDSHAVLMLGGGLGNDLEWSVPASFALNGQAHADAPAISKALTDAGFLAARWSTIRVGDPKADKWPDEVTPYTYDQTLEQARAALAALRALDLVAPDHIILLGHSLGARRALNICADDHTIARVICLSAADIARTGWEGQGHKQELRGEAGRIHAEMDRTGDGRVERWEFQSWAPAPGPDAQPRVTDTRIPTGADAFSDLDADGDGVLRRWEIEARLISPFLHNAASPRTDRDPKGRPWGEDALDSGPRALLVYGGLDAWASQGVAIRDRVIPGASGPSVRFLPGLGHNLGEERDGKFGPIDRRALDAVVDWLLHDPWQNPSPESAP